MDFFDAQGALLNCTVANSGFARPKEPFEPKHFLLLGHAGKGEPEPIDVGEKLMKLFGVPASLQPEPADSAKVVAQPV